MISKIQYDLTFSNGKTIRQDLELTAGSTLITGANGKGKSLNFEIVGFSLFGNKALRGVAGDYKRMKVEVTLSINGETYTIKRTKSKSEVFHKDEMIVSGTKPVNQWVVRTLGYGFDVFRIAHWCAQGDIQALADMRPTERKAMIDSVAGLTQMDGLANNMAGEIRELRAIVDTHKKTLVEPVAPVAPESPKADIEASLAEFKAKLETWLTNNVATLPAEPTEPTEPEQPIYPDKPEPVPVTLEAPKFPELNHGMPGTISQLTTLETTFQKKLDQAREVETEYLKLEAQYCPCEPNPEWPNREELVAEWSAYERYERIQELKASHTIECPSCKHHFHLSAEIEQLEKQPLRETAPSLTVGDFDKIAHQLEINQRHDTLLEELQRLEIDDLRTALHEVRTAKSSVMQFEQANQTYKAQASKIAQLNQGQISNWEKTCERIKNQYENQIRQYNSQSHHYKAAKASYLEAKERYEAAQQSLADVKELFPVNTEACLRKLIANLENERQEWVNYDQLKAQYETSLETYTKSLEGVAVEEARLSELTRARDALKVIKSKVQSHLLPSLNKVASMLMSEMTGGEFQSVEVGQDFEVMVDGQPLRTLSGSGKDLANLTLRIGLGRILTHRVLPLMMLDEIDSAMDDTRASFTWQCIQRITPHIGQVLQASHKELDAQSRVAV
tara:strand:+ start:13691 stop:15715 length:2025 start_codon:yes stop_codon:yes gene_type:complete